MRHKHKLCYSPSSPSTDPRYDKMGSAEPNGPSKVPHIQHDSTFTDKVIAATGPKAHARLVEIMPSLIRHLHDFARESNLTVAEWAAGVEFVSHQILRFSPVPSHLPGSHPNNPCTPRTLSRIRRKNPSHLTVQPRQINECGRMSTDKRNETQLLCDILGLESLVDDITAKLLGGAAATPSAILGPFYRQGAPELPNGSSIVRGLSPSLPWYDRALEDAAFIHGRVYSSSSSTAPVSTTDGDTDGTRRRTLNPLPGATIDVWHTAPNGLYEQQDPLQPDMNLRGRFTADSRGHFSFYALRPVPYAIPDDGPAGRLLALLDRGPFRPAHIHFVVEAAGHRALVTQVFDAEDGYVRDDAVFAVKEELVVRFERRVGDERARWGLEYDFVLVPEVELDGMGE